MVPLPQGYCDAANSAVGITIKEHITYYLEQLEIAPEIAVSKMSVFSQIKLKFWICANRRQFIQVS